jgi:hypothetical protein
MALSRIYPSPSWKLAAPSIITPFWFVAGYGLILRRKLLTKPMSRAELAAVVSPVLFLRAFRDDQSSASLRSTISLSDTNEQALERIVAPGTAFVAVGRPSEGLPTLGAKRVYLEDDIWQTEVARLISKSSLIFFRPELTSGVDWELGEIIRQGALARTVLFFPQDEDDSYTNLDILRVLNERHALGIPLEAVGSVFVAFTSGGKPVFDTRYRPFLDLSTFRQHRATKASIFRPPPGYGFWNYYRGIVHVNPSILYYAELATLYQGRAIPLRQVPLHVRDYVLMVMLAVAALGLTAAIGVLLWTWIFGPIRR